MCVCHLRVTSLVLGRALSYPRSTALPGSSLAWYILWRKNINSFASTITILGHLVRIYTGLVSWHKGCMRILKISWHGGIHKLISV